MEFETPLEEGILLQRYKRFLADVRRPDGEEFTNECAARIALTSAKP